MDALMKHKGILLAGVGLIVLALFLKNSSSTGTTGADGTTVASQSLASTSNVQLAGLTTSQNIAQIGANSHAFDDNTALALATTQASTQQFVTSLGFLSHLNDVQATKDITNSTITGSIIQQKQTQDATLALNASQEAYHLQLAPIQSETAKSLATISANEATSIANISAANEATIAGINASTAISLAQIKQPSGTSSDLASAGQAAGLLASIASFF